jgi:hypothetical protein
MDNTRKEGVEYGWFLEKNRAVPIMGQIADLFYPG